MPKVRAVDTQIMYWGIQEKAKPEDLDKIPLAKNLLADLDRKKIPIVVTSVALAEFLTGYEANAHFEILQTFQKRFQVLAYDAASAVHAARIYQKIHPEVLKQEVPGTTRGKIRADTEILGTLLSNGIDFLYSHDKGIQNIAKNYLFASLHVEEIPLTLALSEDEEDKD